MIKIITVVSLFSTFLFAKILISPIDVLKQNYSSDAVLKKSNIILTKRDAATVEKIASSKLKSKIFRYFRVFVDNKTVGYGILLSETVRSKNAVILYVIDINGTIKTVEIIAFNEPMEFIASDRWISQFKDTNFTDKLFIGKNIPTITGATLTARTLVNGSRIASAFYEIMLKAK